MIIAVNIRVKVRLKVKRANRVIDTINTTLDCTPKRFNRVDMSNARDILFGCVLDNLVGISQFGNLPVTGQLIGEDGAIIGNVPSNHGQKCSSLNIRHYLSNSVPLAFG